MAIRARVLAKLAAIEASLNAAIATPHCTALDGITKAISDLSDLYRCGLPKGSYAIYGEVCDGIIVAIKGLLAGEPVGSSKEVLSLCLDLLQHLAGNTIAEQHFKKEIVFLPYKAAMFDSMESVWQAATNDSEHAVAYVVPIPYFDRTPDGKVREWHCETAKFPKYVPVLDYRHIDLKAMHPDVIVIQNPYDDYNTVTSVDATYYSRNLKKWTDKLVYIPYFVLDEIDPDDEDELEGIVHFVFHGEGVVNADLTIVQSENMREAYIRLLTKYTDKGRPYWEKRILGLGSPKIDKVLSTKRENIELPKSWRRVIEKPCGTRKKVIFYNASLSNLMEYQDKLLDKMAWVFGQFREWQEEVALLWRPHPLFEATIDSRIPELWERYREMVERYRNEGWGIYDDSEDVHRAIAVSDGYYGDGSSIVPLFQAMGKPILIQNLLAANF